MLGSEIEEKPLPQGLQKAKLGFLRKISSSLKFMLPSAMKKVNAKEYLVTVLIYLAYFSFLLPSLRSEFLIS